MADARLTAAVLSPREVANKSNKRSLLRAIRMALAIESPAVRHNTQTLNRNRYNAVAMLPDYDLLKDQARRIKENSIANLPELLKTLEAVICGRGGHVYLAAAAQDASRYIPRRVPASRCQTHCKRQKHHLRRNPPESHPGNWWHGGCGK